RQECLSHDGFIIFHPKLFIPQDRCSFSDWRYNPSVISASKFLCAVKKVFAGQSPGISVSHLQSDYSKRSAIYNLVARAEFGKSYRYVIKKNWVLVAVTAF